MWHTLHLAVSAAATKFVLVLPSMYFAFHCTWKGGKAEAVCTLRATATRPSTTVTQTFFILKISAKGDVPNSATRRPAERFAAPREGGKNRRADPSVKLAQPSLSSGMPHENKPHRFPGDFHSASTKHFHPYVGIPPKDREPGAPARFTQRC